MPWDSDTNARERQSQSLAIACLYAIDREMSTFMCTLPWGLK